jgi:hypothetical protein
VVRRALENSLCFGLYKQGRQVGLARVVTDRATFAWLCDVFVLEEYRGERLSKWLMASVMAHPAVQGLLASCWRRAMPRASTSATASRRWPTRVVSWRSSGPAA